MANCIPESIDGVLSCKICKRPMSAKYPNAKRNCGIDHSERPMPKAIQNEVAAHAEASGMLIGDVIAAMTTAVGIPPCEGCKKTQQKLNEWHAAARAWMAGYFSPKS